MAVVAFALCVRVADHPVASVQAEIRFCVRCGAEVWVDSAAVPHITHAICGHCLSALVRVGGFAASSVMMLPATRATLLERGWTEDSIERARKLCERRLAAARN